MDDAPRGDIPPTFDGDIANYKDWRRRAELWLYSTRADANKRAPRLLGALVGSAWEACKHLSIAELATDGAWDKIFKILEIAQNLELQINLSIELTPQDLQDL